MDQASGKFVDDHNRVVPHDGSPVEWRISVQAVVEQHNRVLLIKDRRQEFFSTPGGGVEVDESMEEALQREMLEEVGTPVQLGQLLFVHQDRFFHRGSGRFFESIIFFFQATLQGEFGTPQDHNVEYARWVPYSQLSPDQLNAVVYRVFQQLGRMP